MTILDTLNNDMKESMKNKDSFALGVIRMAKGAIQLEAINSKKELTEEDVIVILAKQIKLRKDSIIEFEKASRTDLVKQNKKEIEILEKYMPEPLTQEELLTIVEEVFSKVKPASIKDLGLIMREITPLVKGKADMKEVNELIKNRLSN